MAAALALPGCTELRPRSERSDGGTNPDDAALDAVVVGCDQAGTCDCEPAVTALGLGVIAHGARLMVMGSCLSDVTAVRIGGVAQTFVVDDDGSITVASIADTTPVGLSQPLVVASPEGESRARNATVAHLVVSEVDARTDGGGMQRRQFVEVDTGLAASVNLADYMVVFFGGSDDGVYNMTRGAVLGTTGTNGHFLIANSMVSGAQASIPNSTLATMPGANAVVLYQGTVLPASTATLATIALPMVDAVVFSAEATANDTGLLDLCYPAAADRLQVDEAANGEDPEDQSVRRCGTKRRAGTSFGVGAPTPGAANGCP